MLPLLRSRNLVSFVDGTNPSPPAFLKDDAGQLTDKVNPDFDAWIQQDAMGTFPTADTLSLSGSPVTDSDLVAIILNNLGPAYESTVASAQARDEAITYSALEALLLGAERRQKLHTVFENGLTAALAAGRGRSGPSRGPGAPRGGRGHFNGGRGQFPPRPQGQEHHAPPPRQPHDGVFGAPPSPTQSGGRIQCQICRRHGHSAIDCFNRLNMAYEGRVPAPRLQAYAAA
ncbi:uncharacterized protein [Malus domestica]|uniref:uncharacterized protein n=1 Tax=Malus domestica TaxID=3750 RepID=UPI003976A8D2